jgi:hypothetical protein
MGPVSLDLNDTVRDLTITNLEYSPARLTTGRGYMCEAGCTVWDIPDSIVPMTVSFDPKLRTFGNCLVVVQCEGTLPCV